MREAVDMATAALPAGSPGVLLFHARLALLLQDVGRRPEAINTFATVYRSVMLDFEGLLNFEELQWEQQDKTTFLKATVDGHIFARFG